MEEDIIIIEIKGNKYGWNFYNDEVPKSKKCDWCNEYKPLDFPCSCKVVSYCSEQCR